MQGDIVTDSQNPYFNLQLDSWRLWCGSLLLGTLERGSWKALQFWWPRSMDPCGSHSDYHWLCWTWGWLTIHILDLRPYKSANHRDRHKSLWLHTHLCTAYVTMILVLSTRKLTATSGTFLGINRWNVPLEYIVMRHLNFHGLLCLNYRIWRTDKAWMVSWPSYFLLLYTMKRFENVLRLSAVCGWLTTRKSWKGYQIKGVEL